MIFKQRLFTVLLGLLFVSVLTDQASALYDPGVGRFCSRDPVFAQQLYGFVGANVFVSIDPMGLSPVCSSFTCTDEGYHSGKQGVYGMFAEIVGSRCHGTSSSGCCNLEGDAYIRFDYVEYNDDAAIPRAQEEFNEIGDKLQLRAPADCVFTRKSTRVGSGRQMVMSVSCPIRCGKGCKCGAPAFSLEILCPMYQKQDPRGPSTMGPPNGPGLCAFFQRFSVNSSLKGQNSSCGFSGCNLMVSAEWKSWKFIDYGRDAEGCKWSDEPKRRDYRSDVDFYTAMEKWFVCRGAKRQTRPWLTRPCSEAQKQKLGSIRGLK